MQTLPESTERRAVVVATASAALLISQQVAARAVRDTLFLSAFRARSLPFAMIASALVGFAAAEALAVALARRSPLRVVPPAALVSAALLALLWPLALVAPRTAAVVLYLQVAAFGGVLVSGFWSLVNESFDPFTARRVMGRIGTGAAAGGVAGGLLAWLASQTLPVEATLLLLAVLHAAVGLALPHVSRGAARGAPPQPSPGLGLPLLLRSPYLRQIAVVVALGSIVESIVDFAFKAQSQQRFASGGALLAPLALFHAGMSVVSLLLQAGVARQAVEHLGIAGTLALRPLLTGAAALLGCALPRFETATLARGAHEALTNSLFRSAYELLYTPVPETEKRRVKALIDVAVDRAGTLVGSGVILATLALAPAGGERWLLALAAAICAVTLGLSARLQRGYVLTLERSLLDGRVRIDPAEVLDRATQLTLAHTGLLDRATLLREIAEQRGQEAPLPAPVQAPARRQADRDPLLTSLADLRSRDPVAVRRALQAHPDPPALLVPALIPLLASDEVFPEALAALRRVAPRCTGQIVDVMLDPDTDPVLQRRLPRVLKGCATTRSAEGLRGALDHPSFDLRAAAALALAALHEAGVGSGIGRELVLARVRAELDSGVPAARQLPHVHALLSLAFERQPLQIAWAALRGSDRSLRGTALEYLSNVLPEDVFPRVLSLFGAVPPPSAPRRPMAQVAEDLRHSSAALRLDEPPWHDGADG